jgi:metal-responsive CopG/Arc/MetJ family transcriptional regulator
MQRNVPIGISLPEDVVSTIDTKRGDVSRSKYLLRILQKTYDSTRPNNMRVRICLTIMELVPQTIKQIPQYTREVTHSREPTIYRFLL